MTNDKINHHGVTDPTGAGSVSLDGTAPAIFDPLPYVHPEIRPLVAPLLAMSSTALTTYEATLLARGAPSFPGTEPRATPEWHEQIVPGHAGNPDVRVYVINAGQRDNLRPAILDMHGGGFIVGTPLSTLGELQELARTLDCVIVTVDYRLAPETKFPGALEDNYAGLKWLYVNTEPLGVDPSRIAVMGGSAGAGHAAMLAIASRRRGEVPISFQSLTYPMLDDRTGSSVKKPPQQGSILWSPESNEYGWTSLLGVPAGSKHVPPGSVPARETNLKGLPPTFISVGSIDLFADESIEYARRLLESGTLVELVVVPGGFHGFDLFRQTTVVQRYTAHYIDALRQGLGLASSLDTTTPW